MRLHPLKQWMAGLHKSGIRKFGVHEKDHIILSLSNRFTIHQINSNLLPDIVIRNVKLRARSSVHYNCRIFLLSQTRN